jgi:coenzyme PQQ biosynthesis protein B
VRLLVIGSEKPTASRAAAAAGRPLPATLPSIGAVALSIDGRPWCLINAPIGLGLHLRRHPRLLDGSPVMVVLTDAQLDHVGGLLALRHGPPIDLHATPAAFEELTQGLPLLQVLEQYCGVRWHLIGISGDRLLAPVHVGGGMAVRLTALDAAGAVPRYSARWGRGSTVGDAIALMIEHVAGRRLLFVPGPDALTQDLLDLTQPHDELVIGTGCSDIRRAQACEDARPAAVRLAELRSRYPSLGRVVLQADLATDLPARGRHHALVDAGIELAFDGTEIEL